MAAKLKKKEEVARIKVAIADDHTLFREGMVRIVSDFENMRVLYDAEDGKELLGKMKEQLPDIVLMDLKMPVMNGMEATAVITKKYPEVKVIALTQYKEEKLIVHMLEKGVCAYLLKTAKPEEVEFVICKVLEEGHYHSKEVAKAVHNSYNAKLKSKTGFDLTEDLTARELEMIPHIAKGHTSDKIGGKLCLSKDTVDKYRKSLLKKTGCANTAELIAWAAKNGLID